MCTHDSERPTVLVVEDDHQLRQSVQALLETVGIAVECFEGPRAFRQTFTLARPGCLLLDIRMPSQTGIELYEELLESGVRMPVIFMTAHADISTAVSAMKTGAVEFLEKPFDRKRLIDLVHRAFALDASWRAQEARFAEIDEQMQSLSPRERETLELVVAGEPNKAISSRLGITERAVEMRRSRLVKKLGVQSFAELVDLAVTHRVLAEVREIGRHPLFRM